MNLSLGIENLTRVGKTTAARLKKLGLQTVEDLVYHFPFRYEDYSELKQIVDLVPDEVVTVKGRVDLIANRRSSRKRMIITECLVTDETGSLKVVWFNQPFIGKTLKPGDDIYLSGKVDIDKYGTQMVSPGYERSLRQAQGDNSNIHTARIVPVYNLTMGITEKQIRFLLSQVLPLIKKIPEILPAQIVSQYGLLEHKLALENIHFPQDETMLKRAQDRLAFDEMFFIQLYIQKLRAQLEQSKAFELKFLEKATKDFVDDLPFTLTDDQKVAAWEIITDLGKSRPMNRLLQGDVGSGKTVVVALAMLNVVLNGYKVVMMAPTEILAQQHFETLQKMFSKMSKKLRVGLFTRSHRQINQEKLTKKAMLDDLKVGNFDLAVGTHALIQGLVEIKDLGLVIIDEQHRFGVKQRKKLVDKSQEIVPHFLSMTATPIPRSLSLALFGDLDVSVIKQMPPGRKPIKSEFVKENKRAEAYKFIQDQIKQGRQVFVICPLIDPSDQLGVKSVTQEFEKLDKEVFPDIPIGLMHGKLKPADKEQVMQYFVSKKTKILVSTSVIEVGIDVPNATIMMIEGADRFGLAQLHQFRGRVGRGEHQSYCFIFTDNNSPETTKRLKAFVRTKDGFELAEKDLAKRGPGEVYGTRQSGIPEVQMANLLDINLIKKAQQAAQLFTNNYKVQDYPQVKKHFAQKDMVLHFE